MYNLCVVWCLRWSFHGMNPKKVQGEIMCINLLIFLMYFTYFYVKQPLALFAIVYGSCKKMCFLSF
jgi:hypothetical protein